MNMTSPALGDEIAVSISIGWRDGGRGACALCKAQVTQRARITSSDHHGAVLICYGCTQKIMENDTETFSRVVQQLEPRYR